MTRAEHVAWCKARSLELLDAGMVQQAFASVVSDLRKHEETEDHPAIELGAALNFSGHLSQPEKMREFIEGIA